MDKQKILNTYMTTIYREMDELRDNFPKSMSKEIIEMEKGFRFCAQKTSEWLEQFLNIMESQTTGNSSDNGSSSPIQNMIAGANQHTNLLGQTNEPKKKKSFFQVAGEASKDMTRDLVNALK